MTLYLQNVKESETMKYRNKNDDLLPSLRSLFIFLSRACRF